MIQLFSTNIKMTKMMGNAVMTLPLADVQYAAYPSLHDHRGELIRGRQSLSSSPNAASQAAREKSMNSRHTASSRSASLCRDQKLAAEITSSVTDVISHSISPSIRMSVENELRWEAPSSLRWYHR